MILFRNIKDNNVGRFVDKKALKLLRKQFFTFETTNHEYVTCFLRYTNGIYQNL